MCDTRTSSFLWLGQTSSPEIAFFLYLNKTSSCTLVVKCPPEKPVLLEARLLVATLRPVRRLQGSPSGA